MLLSDSRAFPAAPPADLDSAASIAAHDQASFDNVADLASHWDSKGWSEETRVLYWFLTFPDSTELRETTRSCQERLAGLELDLVPLDGLHVTLARVGDAAHTPDAVVADLLERVRAKAPGAFEIEARPMAGSRGAVRYSLSPWRPIVALHSLLSGCGQALGVPGGTRGTSSFRPHLSIAYNPVARPAGPVIEAVQGMRSLPPVPLRVTGVDLVELRREDRTYRWNARGRIDLAQCCGQEGSQA